MPDFTMPSLGADMDEGTLLEWLVKPGDTVHKGDIVAVVDTAKAAVEVESFVGGVLDRILVEPGQTVPVGTPLARLSDGRAAAVPTPRPAPTAETMPGGPEPVTAKPPVASPLVRRVAAELGVDLTAVAGTGRGGRITRRDVERAALLPAAPPAAASATPAVTVRPSPVPSRVAATPYARRLAAELGVDLAAVTASGGRVSAEDVRAAATRAAPPEAAVVPEPAAPAGRGTPPEEASVEPRAGKRHAEAMRESIARLMARSKREIPHYYLSTTVDLAPTLAWMTARNRDLPVTRRLVPAALLLKATALAARSHPQLNGFWVDDGFRPGSGVHLGVAVSLRGGGLVAPALHDADTLALDELMAAMRDLVTRARAGRLRGSEMSDPTLTVTNLGDQGVESVIGVIYPPQVALVGFGRVVERPWAVDGLLGVRPVTTLTLAADHRATDGFTGARFLADIEDHLHHPDTL